MSLHVVILAAGKGKRMVSDLPKVLHAVGGRPMLGHVIATAQRLAAERIVVDAVLSLGPLRAADVQVELLQPLLRAHRRRIAELVAPRRAGLGGVGVGGIEGVPGRQGQAGGWLALARRGRLAGRRGGQGRARERGHEQECTCPKGHVDRHPSPTPGAHGFSPRPCA